MQENGGTRQATGDDQASFGFREVDLLDKQDLVDEVFAVDPGEIDGRLRWRRATT